MLRWSLRMVALAAGWGLATSFAAPPEVPSDSLPPVPGAAIAQARGTSEASATADPDNTSSSKTRGADGLRTSKTDHGFTPEREAAALTFVKQNHPELAALLATLKSTNDNEYCRAIRDLFRTSERLAASREKSPDRYLTELAAWQLKSRSELLATRLRFSPDDAKLRTELKQALTEQFDVRLRLLQHEREKMVERLERLDEQIGQLQSERVRLVEKQFQVLAAIPKKPTHSKEKPSGAGKEGPKRPAKDQGDDRPKTAKPISAENRSSGG